MSALHHRLIELFPAIFLRLLAHGEMDAHSGEPPQAIEAMASVCLAGNPIVRGQQRAVVRAVHVPTVACELLLQTPRRPQELDVHSHGRASWSDFKGDGNP